MSSIDFASYTILNTYAILAQASITSAGTTTINNSMNAGAPNPPFYGTSTGTSITGTYVGGSR